jgi:hypothetical protein
MSAVLWAFQIRSSSIRYQSIGLRLFALLEVCAFPPRPDACRLARFSIAAFRSLFL